MLRQTVLDQLEESPVIAAVKDEATLGLALASPAKVMFLLFGTVLDIPRYIADIHAAGKTAFVHLDLVEGLAAQDAAVDYIALSAHADGLLTTKSNLLRRAKSHGLLTVRRFFVLDSISLKTLEKSLQNDAPDFIEILPGLLPDIIQDLVARHTVPLIAGGLIQEKKNVVQALSAGALAVSTTRSHLWTE